MNYSPPNQDESCVVVSLPIVRVSSQECPCTVDPPCTAMAEYEELQNSVLAGPELPSVKVLSRIVEVPMCKEFSNGCV